MGNYQYYKLCRSFRTVNIFRPINIKNGHKVPIFNVHGYKCLLVYVHVSKTILFICNKMADYKWKTIYDGIHTIFFPNQQTLACDSVGEDLYFLTNQGLVISHNGGKKFTSNVVEPNIAVFIYSDVFCDPSGENIVVQAQTAAASWQLYLSSNYGSSWSVGIPLQLNAKGTSIAVNSNNQYILLSQLDAITTLSNIVSVISNYGNAYSNAFTLDTGNPGKCFINLSGELQLVTTSNQIYRSYDYGNAWESNSIPTCSNIIASYNCETLLGYSYETSNGISYVSRDFGSNWTSNTINLYYDDITKDEEPIESVSSDSTGNNLYLFTSLSNYISSDYGSNWTSFQSNFALSNATVNGNGTILYSQFFNGSNFSLCKNFILTTPLSEVLYSFGFQEPGPTGGIGPEGPQGTNANMIQFKDGYGPYTRITDTSIPSGIVGVTPLSNCQVCSTANIYTKILLIANVAFHIESNVHTSWQMNIARSTNSNSVGSNDTYVTTPMYDGVTIDYMPASASYSFSGAYLAAVNLSNSTSNHVIQLSASFSTYKSIDNPEYYQIWLANASPNPQTPKHLSAKLSLLQL